MPGPRVAVGFIGDKKPTRCMHFDTMPNQTPLRHKATSALAGSAPRQPVGKPVSWGRSSSRVTSRHFDHGNGTLAFTSKLFRFG